MTEQQAYEVVRTYAQFELRRYLPHVVAEVVVRAPFEEAGNEAFRTLLGYISGQNRSATKVAMTAPVIQGEAERAAWSGHELPTEQRETDEGAYAVAFVLPSAYTREAAPTPTSPQVRLRDLPGGLAAARRYRGRWTQASFEHHRDELDHAVRASELVPSGPARWARFDPPFVPFFLRRNEVVQDVVEDAIPSDMP